MKVTAIFPADMTEAERIECGGPPAFSQHRFYHIEIGDTDNPITACEKVFWELNKDDRFNGQTDRSMSIGDMVEFKGEFYLCGVFGFHKITPEKKLEVEALDFRKRSSLGIEYIYDD